MEKKKEFEIKEMERFIVQKIITGGVRHEVRGPTGPSCTRHPLNRPNQPWRGEGGEEKSRKHVNSGVQEKGNERRDLSAVPLGAFSRATAYQRVFCESIIAVGKFLFISSGK